MLFTTFTFALLFLPLTWVGFFVIGGISRTGAVAWLFGASLVFYGYWMPTLTPLLVASIAANLGIGSAHARASARLLDVGPYDGHLNPLGAGLAMQAAARALRGEGPAP